MVTLWNLGSIATEVTNVVINMPSPISGTNMYNIIEGAINYIEGYSNVVIGSTSINQIYHNAIVYKVMIDVLNRKNIIYADVGNISLGDLSINTGASTLGDTTIRLKLALDDELRILGRSIKIYKANS